MIRGAAPRRRALPLLLLGGAIAAAGTWAFSQTPASRPAIGRPIAHRFTGVNLAGGEFASRKLPGRHGYDYLYPTARVAAPFLAAGMDAVRLPFVWERLQPAPGQPLDPGELARLDAAIGALKGFRLIILDPHNYGAYGRVKLGQPDRPAALLADLWTRLATRYAADPRIAFGLMNEPNGIGAAEWRTIAEQALLAIRATGARNLVLVPGTGWTGAHSWLRGGPASNGAALAGLVDPAGNMAFEMHQYLDENSSGIKPACVSPERAAARLEAATDWLRANKARGFLGEFGAAPDPACLAALGALLDAVDAAPDVWLGWTYWAGGALWGKYPMSIQPGPDGPKPQSAVLAAHIRRR